MPSERLRKLEIDANTAFDQYREMYFEGGVSSVYLWDLDHGFAGKLNIFICWIYLQGEYICKLDIFERICTTLSSVAYRSHSHQEGWWRRFEEDQGLLGLDPRGGGPGEELGQVGALQVDQHQHALAADQQGQEWHHEPWWLAHTPGDKKYFVAFRLNSLFRRLNRMLQLASRAPTLLT